MLLRKYFALFLVCLCSAPALAQDNVEKHDDDDDPFDSRSYFMVG